MLRMLMGEARQLGRASGGCEEDRSVGGEGAHEREEREGRNCAIILQFQRKREKSGM